MSWKGRVRRSMQPWSWWAIALLFFRSGRGEYWKAASQYSPQCNIDWHISAHAHPIDVLYFDMDILYDFHLSIIYFYHFLVFLFSKRLIASMLDFTLREKKSFAFLGSKINA